MDRMVAVTVSGVPCSSPVVPVLLLLLLLHRPIRCLVPMVPQQEGRAPEDSLSRMAPVISLFLSLLMFFSPSMTGGDGEDDGEGVGVGVGGGRRPRRSPVRAPPSPSSSLPSRIHAAEDEHGAPGVISQTRQAEEAKWKLWCKLQSLKAVYIRVPCFPCKSDFAPNISATFARKEVK